MSESEYSEWLTKQGKNPSPAAKKNKFGAQKSESDGIKFDSKAEEKRYHHLKIRERLGEIRDLEVHPRWDLKGGEYALKIRSRRYPDGKQCVFTADFKYFDIELEQVVIEDVKGIVTDLMKLRIAAFEMFYGERVVLIRKGEVI
ncbi:MAG: DUF1064 domain-containing protein [Pseudomonadaceae bacterium]|nr:DUF1064 domain-containing protein [Pseudomonadaceae bacterium]